MSLWHGLWNLQTLEAAVFVFGWTRTAVLQATTGHSSRCSSVPCDAAPPFIHHCPPPPDKLTEVRTYFHSPASKEAAASTLCPLPASGAPSTAVVTNDTLLHTPYSTHLGRPWLHLFFQRPHHFPQTH